MSKKQQQGIDILIHLSAKEKQVVASILKESGMEATDEHIINFIKWIATEPVRVFIRAEYAVKQMEKLDELNVERLDDWPIIL